MKPQKLIVVSKSTTKSIVVASVLKPINDIRMYQKIVMSGQEILPDWDWHIIGFEPSEPVKDINYTFFYPIFKFNRLSLKRLKVNFTFYKYLTKIKPSIIIVTTFELLPASIWYAKRNKVKLVYDVVENYAINAKESGVYGKNVGFILSKIIRNIEKWADRYIDLYVLAESIYAKQIPFMNKKKIFLENKTILLPHLYPNFENKEKQKLQFILAGTLAESYGIFVFMKWIEQAKKINPTIYFTIIGFCAKSSDYQKILDWTEGKNWVTLIGGNQLVAHQKIIQEIKESDILVMPYLLRKNFIGKIPTKFYEGIALRKKILVTKEPNWQLFFKKISFKVSVFVDFEDFKNIPEILEELKGNDFYKDVDFLPDFIYWESEKKSWQTWLKKQSVQV